jgi:hypothetical protein
MDPFRETTWATWRTSSPAYSHADTVDTCLNFSVDNSARPTVMQPCGVPIDTIASSLDGKPIKRYLIS